jgi:hypothetical protein
MALQLMFVLLSSFMDANILLYGYYLWFPSVIITAAINEVSPKVAPLLQ